MKISLCALQMTAPRLLLAAGLLMAAQAGLFAQDTTGFRISGHLKNIQAEWIYLSYIKDGRQILDSAKVNNGSYVFNGEVSENNPATIQDVPLRGIRPLPARVAKIYLTPESFAITHIDSFSNTLITGSAINTAYKKIQEQTDPTYEKEIAMLPRFQAARNANDDSTVKAIKQWVDSLDGVLDKKVYGPYAGDLPHSPLAFYVLQLYAANEPDAKELLPLFDGLNNTIRESKAGNAFREKLSFAAKTRIGAAAMDFTQDDTLGKPVILSSFKGKYVLLDFWASWCGPCRAENPNVVKAYAQYHPKGFEILSVSLDRQDSKDKWMKAIHDDGLTWTHVSDLQAWNNAVAKEYGVLSIPQNFLIDPNGKIIGKGLRGNDLEEKLREIYKD